MKDQYKTVKVERRIENGMIVFYRAQPNPKFYYPTQEIPKDLFIRYVEAMHEPISISRQIDAYFRPIKDKSMYVAKNHERFDYATQKYLHDGEYLRWSGGDPDFTKELDKLNSDQ